MLNSVSGNVQNDVVVQKNKIQKSNIAYRGKVTNTLEVTPEKDEFKKEGLGKGSKILLATLGLAGIAVAVDRLFLKGKYTDDILKWLKNNGDDATKGSKEGIDDLERFGDDCIDIDIPAEDLKILDDMDLEKLVDDVDLEKLADDVDSVIGDPSVIKKTDIFSDGILKPIENTAKEATEEVQIVTPNKNEIVENIEDEVARTKKLIEDAGYQVAEVKPIDDAEGVIKRAIKELDDEAEKAAKKQQEEARRIEQENVDMAVIALLADDALRQGKNKVDDVAKSLENKIDDVVEKIEDNIAEDLVANANKNSDNVLGEIADSPFINKVDDVVDDFANSRMHDNFGSESVVDDVSSMYPSHTMPEVPSLYETEVAHMSPYSSSFGVDDVYNQTNHLGIDDFDNPTMNPMSGIDDLLSSSDNLGGFGMGDDLLSLSDDLGGFGMGDDLLGGF